MGNARPLPESTTTAEPVLELRAKGLDCPTAYGCASVGHRLVVEMVTMIIEVVYFPFHNLLDFSGALGWAFQQLFQATDDSRFPPMTQIMQKLLHPLCG